MIHLPGFPIRVVVEDDLQLVGGARVVHQPGDEILHLRGKTITCPKSLWHLGSKLEILPPELGLHPSETFQLVRQLEDHN